MVFVSKYNLYNAFGWKQKAWSLDIWTFWSAGLVGVDSFNKCLGITADEFCLMVCLRKKLY